MGSNQVFEQKLPILLKYAGGKRKLSDQIISLFPSFSGTYFEPFVGGGAIAFILGRPQTLINDKNTDLINFYRVIKNDYQLFWDMINTKQFANDPDTYYRVRAWDKDSEYLKEMRTALDHHYAHNRHHPEFFPEALGFNYEEINDEDLSLKLKTLTKESKSSINNMNLFDILEMFIDWMAAVKRHDSGNIEESIEINKDRFGINEQLVNIFRNTIPWVTDEFEMYQSQKDLGPIHE